MPKQKLEGQLGETQELPPGVKLVRTLEGYTYPVSSGYKSSVLTGGRFFQVASKGLKYPENKGGKKPSFCRSFSQRKPI